MILQLLVAESCCIKLCAIFLEHPASQTVLQELSKITMPVIFNEPLSFLQRVVEYMEYGRLLERASACDDPIERHEVRSCRILCDICYLLWQITVDGNQILQPYGDIISVVIRGDVENILLVRCLLLLGN